MATAFKHSFALSGKRPAVIVFAVLSLVCGIAIGLFFWGQQAFSTRWADIIVSVVLAPTCAFSLFLMWSFLVAPFLMPVEDRASLDEEKRQLTARLNAASSERDRMATAAEDRATAKQEAAAIQAGIDRLAELHRIGLEIRERDFHSTKGAMAAQQNQAWSRFVANYVADKEAWAANVSGLLTASEHAAFNGVETPWPPHFADTNEHKAHQRALGRIRLELKVLEKIMADRQAGI